MRALSPIINISLNDVYFQIGSLSDIIFGCVRNFFSVKMVGGLLKAFLLLSLVINDVLGKFINQCKDPLIETPLFSVAAQSDMSGPVFIQEPPNNKDFSNTTGKFA